MITLNVEERQVGDVMILDLDGNLTFGKGSVVLPQVINRLLKEGKKKILLNFAGVRFVDSSGVGVLVSSSTLAAQEGGQIKLLNVPEAVKDLLRLTNLLASFEIYAGEAPALDSYRNP